MTTPTCALVTESLSAFADGEIGPLVPEQCDAHLASCADCRRFELGLLALVRTSRVQPAQPVPDLTAAILAAAPRIETAEHDRQQQRRWTLGMVGATQVVVALAAAFSTSGHLGRDLAMWQLALGVGFLVASWQPRHAAGMLPMLAVLALAAVVGSAVGVLGGARDLLDELPHLAEIAGLVLVWQVGGRDKPTRAITLATRS